MMKRAFKKITYIYQARAITNNNYHLRDYQYNQIHYLIKNPKDEKQLIVTLILQLW